jgi:hypothetical protein
MINRRHDGRTSRPARHSLKASASKEATNSCACYL